MPPLDGRRRRAKLGTGSRTAADAAVQALRMEVESLKQALSEALALVRSMLGQPKPTPAKSTLTKTKYKQKLSSAGTGHGSSATAAGGVLGLFSESELEAAGRGSLAELPGHSRTVHGGGGAAVNAEPGQPSMRKAPWVEVVRKKKPPAKDTTKVTNTEAPKLMVPPTIKQYANLDEYEADPNRQATAQALIFTSPANAQITTQFVPPEVTVAALRHFKGAEKRTVIIEDGGMPKAKPAWVVGGQGLSLNYGEHQAHTTAGLSTKVLKLQVLELPTNAKLREELQNNFKKTIIQWAAKQNLSLVDAWMYPQGAGDNGIQGACRLPASQYVKMLKTSGINGIITRELGKSADTKIVWLPPEVTIHAALAKVANLDKAIGIVTHGEKVGVRVYQQDVMEIATQLRGAEAAQELAQTDYELQGLSLEHDPYQALQALQATGWRGQARVLYTRYAGNGMRKVVIRAQQSPPWQIASVDGIIITIVPVNRKAATQVQQQEGDVPAPPCTEVAALATQRSKRQKPANTQLDEDMDM